MSRSLGQLTLDLIAKIGGFIAPLDKAERHTKQRMKNIQRSADETGKFVGKALAGIASGVTFSKIIANTIEQERVTAQLEATLKSTGKYTPELSKNLQLYASELQGLTTYGDEAIIASQALLLTFTQIGGTAFPRAQKAILDVATAMGTDLKSATLQVGKALNDPIKGVSALAKSGIQFTASQKDVIKQLVETGDAAGAQAIILSELERQFGGSAEAARNTLGGSLTALKNAFGDLLEGDSGGEGVKGTIASINDLTKVLNSPEVKAGFAVLVDGSIAVVSNLAKATAGIASFAKYVGEDFAAGINGVASDDLPRLSKEIEVARKELKWLLEDFNRPRIARSNPFISSDDLALEVEKARKRLEGLESSYKSAAEAQKLLKDKSASSVADKLKVTADPAIVASVVIKPSEPVKETVYAYDDLLERIKEQIRLNKIADEEMAKTNSQAQSIADEFKSAETLLMESYERRRQIVLDNTEITGEAQSRLLADLENKKNADLEEINAGYWDRWLSAAEENLANFDQLSAGVIYNFSSGFGNAFESIIFDSENLGDAISNLAEGMARSVVNALGQMAAQWLAYQAVQLLVGKTTQATAAAGMTSNALAAQQMAALNAFASTAAIPIVGPFAAPGAAAAALAATTPMVAAVTAFSAAGMAHDGIDSVPKTGTWLLEKGERVTTEKTSAKLDRTLSDIQKKQGSGGNISVINQTTGRVDNASTQRMSNGDLAIILQEVAGAIGNPNSDISRSLSANTTASRSR